MSQLQHKKYPIDDKVIQFYSLKLDSTFSYGSKKQNSQTLRDYFFKQLDTFGAPTMFTTEIESMNPLILKQYLEKIEFPVSIPYIIRKLQAEPVSEQNELLTQKPYYILGQLLQDLCLLSANCRVFNEKNQRLLEHAGELEETILSTINKTIYTLYNQHDIVKRKIKSFPTYKTFQEVTFLLFPPGLVPNIYALVPEYKQVKPLTLDQMLEKEKQQSNQFQQMNQELSEDNTNNTGQLLHYYKAPDEIVQNITFRQDIDDLLYYISKSPSNFPLYILISIIKLIKEYKGANKPFKNFLDDDWELDLRTLQQKQIRKILDKVKFILDKQPQLSEQIKKHYFQFYQKETQQHTSYKRPEFATIEVKVKNSDQSIHVKNYIIDQASIKQISAQSKEQDRIQKQKNEAQQRQQIQQSQPTQPQYLQQQQLQQQSEQQQREINQYQQANQTKVIPKTEQQNNYYPTTYNWQQYTHNPINNTYNQYNNQNVLPIQSQRQSMHSHQPYQYQQSKQQQQNYQPESQFNLQPFQKINKQQSAYNIQYNTLPHQQTIPIQQNGYYLPRNNPQYTSKSQDSLNRNSHDSGKEEVLSSLSESPIHKNTPQNEQTSRHLDVGIKPFQDIKQMKPQFSTQKEKQQSTLYDSSHAANNYNYQQHSVNSIPYLSLPHKSVPQQEIPRSQLQPMQRVGTQSSNTYGFSGVQYTPAGRNENFQHGTPAHVANLQGHQPGGADQERSDEEEFFRLMDD